MAHREEFFFVASIKNFIPSFFSGVSVLEVGSLNINGSVRAFFDGTDYTGIDICEGKDVDVVCYGENFAADASSYDVIISCEAMEHNPGWKKTWLNMLR